MSASRDASHIGPKGASLERMREAGLPVPEARYLPGACYREHLEASDLTPLIRSRAHELDDRHPDTGETAVPEAALSEIRSAIVSAPLVVEVERALREHYMALGGGIVAVRSSATAEDLPDASFAGQHGTYFAANADELLLDVKHCWASLWTDCAFAYRDRADIDHLSVDMAVIVQRLVPADAAGVAFTADPVSGEPIVIVEAVRGIGESLVSGKAAPDRWLVDPATMDVREQAIARQDTQIVATGEGRVTERRVDAAQANEPVLTEAFVHRIAELALRADDLFGCALDIEFAVEEDDVWLLQARPITTLTPSSGEKVFVWSSVNVGEVLPDVVTPLNWSLLHGFVQDMLVGLFGHLGVTIGDVDVVRLFAGRAYFNVTVLGVAFRTIPGLGTVDLDELLGGMHDQVEIPPELLDYELEAVQGGWWNTLRSLPSLARYLISHAPKHAGPFCNEARARTEQGVELLRAGLSEDELIVEMRALIRELIFMSDGLGFAGTAMSHWNSLLTITRRWLGDDDRAIATGLLAGTGNIVSAEAGLALWDLSAIARTSLDVTDAVSGDAPWADVRPVLAASEDGRAFLGRWDGFLAEHGHHSRGELEVSNARWAESPDYVLDTVRGYLAADDIDVRAELRRSGEARERLTADCRARLRNPVKRALFDYFLRQAQEGSSAREVVKSEGVRRVAAIRWFLLELGDRLASRGILEVRDDIFFLRLDELDAVRHLVGPFDVKKTVRSRRAEAEVNSAAQPPPVIIGDWNPRTGRTPTLGDADELHGLGVSPGIVRGPARVIASVDHHETVLPGEILVAPFTDPGWTPYFLPAAGIVMDMGGMLSHGSIIAREYGIPAVVNVGPATRVVETGDEIEVDGDHGIVRLLDGGPAS